MGRTTPAVATSTPAIVGEFGAFARWVSPGLPCQNAAYAGIVPAVAQFRTLEQVAAMAINSTYFGLLAEFGEANVPLAKIAPKYFGLSFAEARRRAPAKMLPCRVFRLGGQKSPWLVSVVDLADLIDAQRAKGP